MKKQFLILILFFQLTIVFGQSTNLIDENGITLGYSQTKYNSQTIDGVNYDQYEVKMFFTNNKSTFIYAPTNCRIFFQNGLEEPKFGSVPKSIGINFGWLGQQEFYGGVSTGYVEYQDHTPIDLDLEKPIKNLYYIQSHVIKPGFKQEFTRYVFTKQGEPLPEPGYKIEFLEDRIDVNADNNVVRTWIERNQNRITPKNGGGFPLPYAYGNRYRNGTPKGNKGDVVTEKSKEISTTTINKYNYGNIPQGIPAVHIFQLNKKIATAQATCGCTTPVVDGNKVTVTFNANNIGPFSKGINITYADGQTETLRIEGVVQ